MEKRKFSARQQCVLKCVRIIHISVMLDKNLLSCFSYWIMVGILFVRETTLRNEVIHFLNDFSECKGRIYFCGFPSFFFFELQVCIFYETENNSASTNNLICNNRYRKSIISIHTVKQIYCESEWTKIHIECFIVISLFLLFVSSVHLILRQG
jgi:hypothetical protein